MDQPLIRWNSSRSAPPRGSESEKPLLAATQDDELEHGSGDGKNVVATASSFVDATAPL